MITPNSAIWTHPEIVIESFLEPLGVDQRVDEVDHDHEGHDRAEDIVEQHLTFFHKRAHRGPRRQKSRRRGRSLRHQAWQQPTSLSLLRRAPWRRTRVRISWCASSAPPGIKIREA